MSLSSGNIEDKPRLFIITDTLRSQKTVNPKLQRKSLEAANTTDLTKHEKPNRRHGMILRAEV